METANRESLNQIDKKKQLRRRLLIGAGVLGAGLGGYGLYKLGHINGQIKANKNLEDVFDNVRKSSSNLSKSAELASEISGDLSQLGRSASRVANNISDISVGKKFSDNSEDSESANRKKRRNKIIRNSLIGIGALGGAAALGYGIYARNKKLRGLKSGLDSLRDDAFDAYHNSGSIGRNLENIKSNASSINNSISKVDRSSDYIEDKLHEYDRERNSSWNKMDILNTRLKDSERHKSFLGDELNKSERKYKNLWGIFKSGQKYDPNHDYGPDLDY